MSYESFEQTHGDLLFEARWNPLVADFQPPKQVERLARTPARGRRWPGRSPQPLARSTLQVKSRKAKIHAVLSEIPQLCSRRRARDSLGRAHCLTGAEIPRSVDSVRPEERGLWRTVDSAQPVNSVRPRAPTPVLARPPARPGLLLTTGADEPIPPFVLSAARPRSLAHRTTLPTGEFLPSPRRQSSRVRRRGRLAGRAAGVLTRPVRPVGTSAVSYSRAEILVFDLWIGE